MSSEVENTNSEIISVTKEQENDIIVDNKTSDATELNNLEEENNKINESNNNEEVNHLNGTNENDETNNQTGHNNNESSNQQKEENGEEEDLKKNLNQEKTTNHNSSNKSYSKGQEDEKSLASRKLFVGGLSWETTKDHLIEYFSKYGVVEDANIKTDLNTGRSRGFGFILFETKETVEKVLGIGEHTINGKSVDPKPAKHKGATPIKKIFVGGLDPNFPESDLREYFSKFGKIEEVELPFDKQKNQRRAFCFLSFESEDIVNEIIKKPKHTLGGKEVDVKKATPPKDQNQPNAFVQWNQFQNFTPGYAPYYQSDYGNGQPYGYGSPSSGSYGISGYSGGGGAYQNNFDYQQGYYGSGAQGYEQTSYYQQPYPSGSSGYDYYGSNSGAFYANESLPTHGSHGKTSKRSSSQSQSYHPYHR